jgi:glycosyltransferase involved in cell wall biosynthesis
VLVFPSIKESLGLTLVEAVMSDNLVIARSTVPTVKEANGSSGFYVADQKGFTEAMMRIYEHPEERSALHEKLEAQISQYSPARTAEDLQKVFESIHIQASHTA